MMPQTLGIDFGTSNTAAGLMAGPNPYLIEVEPGKTTLPTSLFFDTQRKVTTYGSAANTALIDGREGRFMRALKSVLGTPLMREERQIAYERMTLLAAVSRFLRTIRDRAEDATGLTLEHAVSGRPVQFHSKDMARNAQAEVDLAEAYEMAGFKSVQFMYEPEAAALAAGPLAPGAVGLIVDIGGGTSDFSVFTRDADKTRIIASHGVRVGGTDFDKSVSLAHVMPLLGRGGQIRNDMGSGTYTAPNSMFHDLASWEKIPFLYTADNRRLAALFAKQGLAQRPFERLFEVLDLEMGHDLAFAVEAGKIAVNYPAAQAPHIDLSTLEKALSVPLTQADLHAALADHAQAIHTCAVETLRRADVAPNAISTVVFVGGSSLMHVVRDVMRTLCPNAALQESAAFTAVASGLAMAAAEADKTR